MSKHKSGGLKKVLTGKVKKLKRLFSGKKESFVVGKQKFYLQLKLTDPKDSAKLINFPEGVRVLLMDNGRPLSDSGAKVLTDSEGKVCLTASSATVKRKPSYHFRVDSDERIFFDIDSKRLVPGSTLKEDDSRKIMELPMVIDTKDGGFHYDEAKLSLKDGMLKNYDSRKKGEGAEGDPIVLETRFYWYFLKFKYYDRIREEWRDVTRGLPVSYRTDGKRRSQDYLKNAVDMGYALGNRENRIQHYLNLLGFSCGEVKGNLADPKVRSAIESFQRQYGLEVTGNADQATCTKLEEVFDRIRVGVYTDSGCYAVPVWKKLGGFGELYFEIAPTEEKLGTSAEHADHDLFLHTQGKSADPVMVDRRKIKKDNADTPYEKLDFLKSRHYYDLPVAWSSRNYWTRYNNSMDRGDRFEEVMTRHVGLYPFVADESKRADPASPLMFSLDDIVLVKADGDQDVKDKDDSDSSQNLSADSRISLFHVKDQDLILYNPEAADQSYFTKLEFKQNLITDVPENAKAVCFANDFYLVHNGRTAQGAEPFTADKHVKGCRAARLSDGNCCFGAAIRGNDPAFAHTRYFAKGTGNYELHYIHDGCAIEGPDGLKRRSFLLVYWNCRIKSAPAPDSVSAAKVRNFETKGMSNAKERWESKGYTLEPLPGGGDIQIKPVFFFEAKKSGLGGRHKCTVTVSSDSGTGWMAIKKSDMYWKDYQVRDYLGVGPFADIDGKRYETLVVSHELGHAEGKDDDYAYHDGDIAASFKNPQDGDYSQYYLGMPYQFDVGSIMNDNRAPRMRHLSFFLNWVNDASRDPNQLKKFLNGQQYRLMHRFGSKTLRYHLADSPNDYRDIHAPFKTVRNRGTGTGTLDFALYKLGEDETAYNYRIGGRRPSFPFDGVLVVFVKLGFTFSGGSAGAWTSADKDDWMEGVKQLLLNLNNRFYLKIPAGGHDFENTYLTFFPICLERAGADAATHYDIRVTLDDSSSISQKTGKTLSVGNEVSKNWVVNYILGKNDGAVVAFFKRILGLDKVGKKNLMFVRDWYRGEMGNNRIEIEGK